MSTAQKVAEAFVEADVPEVEVYEEVEVRPTTKRARVKGTWQMYWGDQIFDFVDGNYFMVPADLYDYLRKRSCIYDTLA
jgi:hypothetical protein